MTEIINLHERRQPQKDGFCMTPTAAEILHVLRFCHEHGEIGLIVGVPGVGKTTAIEHYMRTGMDGDPAAAFLVTGSEATRNLVPAMLAVCRAMGRVPNNRGVSRCLETIDRQICDRCMFDEDGKAAGRTLLLIVDEAGYFSDPALDQMRALHDRYGFGLVLCGNPKFRGHLKGGERGARFAQLVSRIGMHLPLNMPSADDVAALCDHFGIGNAPARARLEKLAERERGLRGVVRTIRTAREFTEGRAIGPADLERALAMRGGEL